MIKAVTIKAIMLVGEAGHRFPTAAAIKAMTLKGIIVVLLLVLFLPVIQMVFPVVKIQPLQEERIKKSRPAVTLDRLRHDLKGLANDVDAWFNDNYGFRELFVRLGTQINFSLLKYSDKVHIGENGFLYYRDVCDTKIFANNIVHQRNQTRILYDRLMRLSGRLNDKGIKLVFIFVPVKPLIYPEFLPRSAPLCQDSCYCEFNHLLKNQSNILYIDLQEELLSLKPTLQVFHRTDFHWTDPAAFVVARKMVNLMGREALLGDNVWKHELKIEEQTFSGGQARFLPLLVTPSERSIFVKPNWDTKGALTADPEGTYFRTWHSFDKDTGRLPRTVFLGNSFGESFFQTGFYVYFEDLFQLQRGLGDAFDFDKAIEYIPPDTKYFVLQLISTQLCWMAAKIW